MQQASSGPGDLAPGGVDRAAQFKKMVAQLVFAVCLVLLDHPGIGHRREHPMNGALGPACHLHQLCQCQRPPGCPKAVQQCDRFFDRMYFSALCRHRHNSPLYWLAKSVLLYIICPSLVKEFHSIPLFVRFLRTNFVVMHNKIHICKLILAISCFSTAIQSYRPEFRQSSLDR